MQRFKFNTMYLINGQNADFSIEAVYTDGEYIVAKHRIDEAVPFEFRLSIRREDRAPIRSWRLLQDIKNEVVGAERAAVEIYPPESEVTDTANIYHLWVFVEGYGPRVRLTPTPKMK